LVVEHQLPSNQSVINSKLILSSSRCGKQALNQI
jgi:hypothetical protein